MRGAFFSFLLYRLTARQNTIYANQLFQFATKKATILKLISKDSLLT